MLKRTVCLVAGFLVFVGTNWAELPKIAVLDVTTPAGFDSSVITPVTESIMEQLVSSGKYLVLDRANIEAIFRERDFQYSGEVSNDQLTQAGQFLGASLVVVSKIQMVGGSYFLSAKMIDTTSAAIVAQTSDSQKGDIAIVIQMARNVGARLGGNQSTATTPVAVSPAITEPAPSPKPTQATPPARDTPAVTTDSERARQVAASTEKPQAPAKTPAKETKVVKEKAAAPAEDPILTKLPVFRIVADLSFPLVWEQSIGSALNGTANYLRTKFSKAYISGNPETRDLGLEANAHLNLGEWFYLAAEYDLIRSQLKDSAFKDPNNFYTNLQVTNILGGLGLSIPLDYWGQIYGGGLIGASTLEIGDLWTSATALTIIQPTSMKETGVGYALEVGLCFYIFHFIALDVRAHWAGAFFTGGSSYSGGTKTYNAAQWYILPNTTSSPELGYTTLSVGLGLAL